MLLNALIFSGFIQGFFLILLLKTKKENTTSDKLLILWLGLTATLLLFYFDSLSDAPLATKYIQIFSFSLPLLSSPIFYLYILSLSFGLEGRWQKQGIHGLAYIILNCLLLFLHFKDPESLTISRGFPRFSADLPSIWAFSITLPLAIIPAIYTFLSLKTLLDYQKIVPDNYSFTEKITLNWLKWIVWSVLFLFILLFLIIKFGVNTGLLNYQNLFAVVGSILSFYVFFIGYFGLRQTTIFTNLPLPTPLAKNDNSEMSYKNSGLTPEIIEQIFEKLEAHTIEKKPFLDENLTLTALALQLEITPNQLSQVINQKTNDNFFNYINGYRVEAVKQKLKDPVFAHYSLLAIGYDCGFRSKSSYNKIFKDLVGMTPSEYQKS
jgi:AraC-like DNA-binding protein